MIPNDQLSSNPVSGGLVNPWRQDMDMSSHWGPVALQDPSEGMMAKLWTARIDGADVLLSSPDDPEFVHYTHTAPLVEVSLAFDQNGNPYLALVDEGGSALLRWYDPVEEGMQNLSLASGTVTPRITLDDARPDFVISSDVILGYVRDGVLRYRRQRDRFADEFTPTQGEDGPTASAGSLHHVSMNSYLRLQFITDDAAPS